jgi:uncharacterized YokU family protein
MECLWCEEDGAEIHLTTVQWQLPDGSRSIELTDVPSVKCSLCGADYQEEDVVEKIETQLLLVEGKHLPFSMKYEDFMKMPRCLKRNYLK